MFTDDFNDFDSQLRKSKSTFLVLVLKKYNTKIWKSWELIKNKILTCVNFIINIAWDLLLDAFILVPAVTLKKKNITFYEKIPDKKLRKSRKYL